MYLRHTTLRKDGKVHRYWRLVRSVRVGRRVIQQTVAHLGELDPEGRARARALARAITGEHEQPDLFDPPEPETTIPVQLKRLRVERGRTFGDVWLGWTLWRALRLDAFLALCRRERCPVAVIGELTADRRLVIHDRQFGNTPVDMPMDVLLGKPPKMMRTARRKTYGGDPGGTGAAVPRVGDLAAALESVLRFPAVADKSFLIHIGDRSVGGLTARDQLVGQSVCRPEVGKPEGGALVGDATAEHVDDPTLVQFGGQPFGELDLGDGLVASVPLDQLVPGVDLGGADEGEQLCRCPGPGRSRVGCPGPGRSSGPRTRPRRPASRRSAPRTAPR